MKIWIIQHGEPPHNLEKKNKILFRYSHLAKKLVSKNISVTFWTTTFWHQKKKYIFENDEEVLFNGYKIKYLHCGSYSNNHSISRIIHHRKFAKKIKLYFSESEPPDLILAAHPIHNVAKEAILYAKSHNVKTIIDLRDFWPDTFQELFPKPLKKFSKFFFYSDYKISKYIFKEAHALVGMMPEIISWAVNLSGRKHNDLNKVFYIGGQLSNNNNKIKNSIIDKNLLKNKLIFNYIGSFTKLTQPEVIIKAAKILQKENFNNKFSFIICGNGDYYEYCKNLAKEVTSIQFTGWIEKPNIDFVNSISLGGIVPSVESATLPNKFFSYCGSSQIIISSSKGTLKNLIKKYSAGFYFEQESPHSLANIFKTIYNMPTETIREMQKNSLKLFNDHFEPNLIYEDFANYLINFPNIK